MHLLTCCFGVSLLLFCPSQNTGLDLARKRYPNHSYVGPITPDGRIWSPKYGNYLFDSAIVSVTTVPGREDALRETLYSLLEQTMPVPIVLALPRRSIRFQAIPYAVSGWLHDMPGVYVLRCEDMGPATKILAAVDFVTSITNVSLRIITVDDDLVRSNERLVLFHGPFRKPALLKVNEIAEDRNR